MAVSERIARHLRQPSGPTGRVVGHLLNQLNRPINRSAVRRLQMDGAESVLEVGFGGGVALDLILNRTDGTVAGIETSNAMLASGRRRFRRQIHRVLAPRGRFVLATECPEDLGRRSYARHGGFRIFRDHELEDLLSGAGYSEVTAQREGTRAFGSFVFAEGLKP